MTVEMINNRKVVEGVSRVIDDEINSNREGYHYDFDTAFENMRKKCSVFDICTAVALTVNKADWDGRFSNTSKKWVENFLFTKDIETGDFKGIRLCDTHRAVLNGFTEWLFDKVKKENLL